jgi:two-component system CheB/CheR fusion protein
LTGRRRLGGLIALSLPAIDSGRPAITERPIATDTPPPSIHTTPSTPFPKGLDADAVKQWLYAFAGQTLDYAILLVDGDATILWANPGAAWILAATRSEIVGNTITQYFTPEDIAFGIPEHEQRSALRQGSSDDDRWMMRADGTRFWASGKTVSLSRDDGTPMGFFKIFRDQTEFKMRVEALRRPPDPDDHAMPAGAGLPPEHPRLSLEEELGAVVASVTSRVDPRERRIEVLFPPGAPIEVRGDRDRLRQAFAVLVENAIGATPDDGHLWINGTTEGDQAVVRVEDNGRGMEAGTLAIAFELFTQPIASSAPASAADTGLARVRAIVEAHGGSAQVRSEGAGKGSEFIVRLPLFPASDTRSP